LVYSMEIEKKTVKEKDIYIVMIINQKKYKNTRINF